ncbi:TonB-dependent receptor [Flavisphingomonas formosensis]|uniref:TonB-dependent receptor n=1 Tax=Flavisphingomonas formosensis TaxID=861534 RepID=UPI0012FAC5C5|nr:TonB-dependent receptor [Sphingomonas formosensis]
MTSLQRATWPFLAAASIIAFSATAAAAESADAGAPSPSADDILVTAQRQQQTIENAPSTRATVTAEQISATVNAVNMEDTLKYLPSLLVRKRHIGDTQAPLATRTSGVGSSARSLIYADGALLSALIGNNNTNASPRWSLVSPQEIARIDVLYGPFSAAYPGNSIGAVVNITTRLPDTLEATVSAGTNVQTFSQYGTDETLPAYQVGGTIGDRFGPLALFASVDHVTSNSQPLLYVTAAQAPVGSNGAYPDRNRLGQSIRVLGASGFEHQRQDRIKLKAALDITPAIRLTYVGGLFLNDTVAHAETYLTDQASGGSVYTSAFSSGVYRTEQRHWSHALSATGSSSRFDWQVIGTLYDYAHDTQRTPTGMLPSAADGGAGTITRLKGSGWKTFDAKGAWKVDAAGRNLLSFGAHGDWFEIDSNRYVTTDWLSGDAGALNLQSKGKTRTLALWAQDAWTILPDLTLTVGGRYEWWKAYDGRNFSLSPSIPLVIQPRVTAHRFSPKASLAWDVAPEWTARLSFGQAPRFPTVGELYQLVTSPVPSVPNPSLKPERARSEELAIERHDAHGSIRLSLFNEDVKDALISQTGPLAGTTMVGTYVQNVDRTRARGVELAVQRTDILPRFDLQASVTYADAETRRNATVPAAEGKLLPQVPRWKATVVGTWRPVDEVSLTAAMRYASRMYGTIDNSDVVGNTYQGFYKYLVVDLRAEFRVDRHWSLGLGVDNVNNDKYFLFHPFTQRSFQADFTWKL